MIVTTPPPVLLSVSVRVNLTPKEKAQLKATADRDGTSMSALSRRLIVAGVRQ